MGMKLLHIAMRCISNISFSLEKKLMTKQTYEMKRAKCSLNTFSFCTASSAMCVCVCLKMCTCVSKNGIMSRLTVTSKFLHVEIKYMNIYVRVQLLTDPLQNDVLFLEENSYNFSR